MRSSRSAFNPSPRRRNAILKLFIDTSVWLDLAKDYRNLPLLTLLRDLVERDDVECGDSLVQNEARLYLTRQAYRVDASEPNQMATLLQFS